MKKVLTTIKTGYILNLTIGQEAKTIKKGERK